MFPFTGNYTTANYDLMKTDVKDAGDHYELSLSCIAQHRGFLRCVLLIAVAVVYRFCRGENKSIFAQRYGAKAPVRAQSTQMSLIEKQKQRQM